MSTPALLLRLLLACALVFSGTGNAFASVAMQLAHAAGAPDSKAPAAHAADALAPCHDQTAGSAMTPEPTELAGTPIPTHASASDDCCIPGQCDCPGIQGPTLAPPAVRPALSGPAHVLVSQALRIDHVPPLLAGLIRPPIG
jgi:hypothetical protein